MAWQDDYTHNYLAASESVTKEDTPNMILQRQDNGTLFQAQSQTFGNSLSEGATGRKQNLSIYIHVHIYNMYVQSGPVPGSISRPTPSDLVPESIRKWISRGLDFLVKDSFRQASW